MTETMKCPRCGETFDHMPIVACCVHDGRAQGHLHPMDPLFGRVYRRTVSAQKQLSPTETTVNETGAKGD
jgi:hypothetical protein